MSSIAVANFLRAAVEASELTQEEISTKANISRQTLHRLLKAEISEARLSTVVKTCNALKLDPLDILSIYFGRQKPSHLKGTTIH